MRSLFALLLPLAALLPLSAPAQSVLKLAAERQGTSDWLVEDTVTHQLKGFGSYKWLNPPSHSPLTPPAGRLMSPADISGLHRAIATETGLTEAQVSALPRRALRVVVTPEQSYSDAMRSFSPKERANLRRWASERGLDTTTLKVGESHEMK